MALDRDALNQLSYRVIGASIRVHRAFGPGVVESPYTLALAQELTEEGLSVRVNVPVTVFYKGKRLGRGYRLDLLVEDVLVVEVKSVKRVTDIHRKQLLSYLTLTARPLGLLINFNVKILKEGVTRIINTMREPGPAAGVIQPERKTED